MPGEEHLGALWRVTLTPGMTLIRSPANTRNVAKTNYGLQGWKRGRIFPDFIFATGGNAGAGRVVVLETKGDHLQNPDTDYKRGVLEFLTNSFSWDQVVPAGQLQIALTGETVECALVLMQDIATTLPTMFQRLP